MERFFPHLNFITETNILFNIFVLVCMRDDKTFTCNLSIRTQPVKHTCQGQGCFIADTVTSRQPSMSVYLAYNSTFSYAKI